MDRYATRAPSGPGPAGQPFWGCGTGQFAAKQGSAKRGCARLDDLELTQDAKQRPRQRQLQRQEPQQHPEPSSNDTDSNHDANSDDDLPPWSHHSQITPEQLTPMLRHYVELKAAHPERVLLYRLGDFFECFFEDAINLSRLLELTLTGKEAGKQSVACPWPAFPTTPPRGTAQN